MKLDIKALAIAIGLVWGGGLIFIALLASFFDYGTAVVELAGSVYLGYSPSIVGALIGGVWGFLDAAIGGIVFGWLYNRLAK